MKCLRITWILFVIVAVQFHESQGIKCWTCDGKSSLKECHSQYGQMQECSQPDHVCQNDYRTVRGSPLIIKGCKQAEACATEVKQNKNANQCGRSRLTKNLVCRCCCSTSGCNSRVSGCLPPPAPCKRIKVFRNGKVYCPHGEIKFGSQCSFSCQNGFELVGKGRVTCRAVSKGSKKGKWIPEELPFCKKVIVRCQPPREAPENGFVKCINSAEYQKYEEFNYAGTACTYSCKKNFYVDGKKITQCQPDRKWNNPAPVCNIASCKPEKVDPNRITQCTDGIKSGSSCSFTCKDGFTLIGYEESSCAQMGDSKEAMWTKRFPRCAKVICQPKITKIANGKVSCNDENFKGSLCQFTCNVGYDMDDNAKDRKSITCEDDGNGDTNGQWSGKPPTCSKISCTPTHNDPQNGYVTCSDKNNFGSVCTFTCSEGYDLDATEEEAVTSVCKDDGDGNAAGKWSARAPTCSAILCMPPPSSPRSGLVRCTDKNNLGSVCSYECEDDYDLEGTDKLVALRTCNVGKKGVALGQWSGPPPVCKSIKCSPLPVFENGQYICSMGRTPYSGSFCKMWCHDGYDMTGISYISCRNLKRNGDAIGDWSAPAPTCELGMCEPPKYDKATVVRKCTAPDGFAVSEYRVGTSCEYKCINEGYYMVPNTGDNPILAGYVEGTCTDEKKWSKLPPRCFVKICMPAITSIVNGHTPKCTDGNTFGSTCRFECLAKHGLTHERPLVCQADGDNDQYGQWSDEIPQCERNECDEYGTITHGRLNCSDGVKIGSVCDLLCIDGYTQKRYEQTICLPEADWSRKKYVCCVKCLFNRRVNILTLFDSTAFATKKEWQNIVDFIDQSVNIMIRYNLNIQLSANRYAEDVDITNGVDKTRPSSKEELDEATDIIANMPITGRFANTGKALKYANEVFFATKDRRREEFLILVTSGNSKDAVAEQAKAIRDRGINILVVGFKTNQSSKKVLLDIAGAEKNLLNAATGSGLAALSEKITVILMTSGCTAASKSQQCS